MKVVLVFILSVLGLSAHANSVVCKNVRTSAFSETVIMKIYGHGYEISHSGHSRNFYKASYAVGHSQGTRYGTVANLEKVSDESTWKDMPSSLTLKHYIIDGRDEFALSGLTKTGSQYVYFQVKHCVQQ